MHSLTLKCIKTSWKRHRILSRRRQCLMESAHELCLWMRGTSTGIQFVTLNVRLLNAFPLSILNCYKWVRHVLTFNPPVCQLKRHKCGHPNEINSPTHEIIRHYRLIYLLKKGPVCFCCYTCRECSHRLPAGHKARSAEEQSPGCLWRFILVFKDT